MQLPDEEVKILVKRRLRLGVKSDRGRSAGGGAGGLHRTKLWSKSTRFISCGCGRIGRSTGKAIVTVFLRRQRTAETQSFRCHIHPPQFKLMCVKTFFFALLAACLGSITPAIAQTTASPGKREVGLQFDRLDFTDSPSFSALYKKQIKPDVYRRLRFFYGNLNTDFSDDNSAVSFSGGIAIGREKRKALDDKLFFYQGPEISGLIGLSTVNWDNIATVVGGRFAWVLGLQHYFNERWAINLEALPGIGVTAANSATNAHSFSLTARGSNSVSVGLMRVF